MGVRSRKQSSCWSLVGDLKAYRTRQYQLDSNKQRQWCGGLRIIQALVLRCGDRQGLYWRQWPDTRQQVTANGPPAPRPIQAASRKVHSAQHTEVRVGPTINSVFELGKQAQNGYSQDSITKREDTQTIQLRS
jgi:hypothetical protein